MYDVNSNNLHKLRDLEKGVFSMENLENTYECTKFFFIFRHFKFSNEKNLQNILGTTEITTNFMHSFRLALD